MSSNPTRLSARHSLELLEALHHTTADFAIREDVLVRDIQSRRYHQQKEHREAMLQAETRWSARLAAVESRNQQEENRLRDLHHQRRGRIQRIHHKELGNVQLNARKAKEKFLSELQLRHLNAKRNLPTELEAADARYAAFSTRLKDERSAYVKVEQYVADSFSGYPSFRVLLRREPHEVGTNPGKPEDVIVLLQKQIAKTREAADEFRRMPIPALFRSIPLTGWIVVIAAVAGALAFVLRANPAMPLIVGGGTVTALALITTLFFVGKKQAIPNALAIAAKLDEAVRLHDDCRAAATKRHDAERQAVQDHYDATKSAIDSEWKRADAIEDDFTRSAEERFEADIPRALASADRVLAQRLLKARSAAEAARNACLAENESQRNTLTAAQTGERDALDREEATRWSDLVAAWKSAIDPLYEQAIALQSGVKAATPILTADLPNTWTPPAHFAPATKLGHLNVQLASTAPKDPRLALPGPATLELPLALAFPEQGSLLFESPTSGAEPIVGTLNLLILRLLASMPPGKVAFTILDPVGLGRNFAGLMHLADYEENLINRRIWTQRDHIEERLTELNEHIEKVIQMYLRNEFANISEYNAQAGSVAEKYHFLIIADFPANFGETATKRLQSILSSGPRCGVFTLMHWDERQAMPEALIPEELRQHSLWLKADGSTFMVSQSQVKHGAAVVLDKAPDATLAAALIHKIGQASVDSNRVEVPFSQIAPKPAEYWTNETTHELRIPIGRTGATKLQYLAIGKGTRQHALFAGKTGSGKSTLFHVIITNLALACSPEQVEFYLIDFKKGVEFKCYASKRLPHARVIAIESDREFGLSVLQRVDDELKRRGELFRKLGVQDVAGYKRAGGTEPMPRSLLMIDEFQEFFVEDDAIAQSASMLFDRIVRQGRAFGIHVLLGSQTLGGAYTLARATLGQMVIRVALQCNEADAYLIMDENNPAPRLLSRPGEGIYNDAAGAIEGNSPFQVVWLPDQERDRLLDAVSELAAHRPTPAQAPIVFEGNAPADIHENATLQRVLGTVPTEVPVGAHIWLGAPNAIKGPTEVTFHRQTGNHLLIVGQRDETALTMLGTGLLALAAQYPAGKARFYFLHAAVPGSPDAVLVERFTQSIPHPITVATGHEVGDVMAELAADLKARAGGESPDAPEVFVFIHGLPRFKKLRYEDDFSFGGSSEGNPGAQLNELINDGSSYGIHLLVTVDTFSNVSRFLNRKALAEFEVRVVFQMSANDSASLIESPKASTLGLHRAILYSESLGQMETFRPYATPDGAWIESAIAALAARKV